MSNVMPASALPMPAAPAPTEADVARAVVLLSEGMLSDEQFQALAGFARPDISAWLTEPGRIGALHRTELELKTSGALARMRAAHASDEAIQLAADIMRNPDLHPSPRLDAIKTVLKAGGAEQPREHNQRQAASVTIRINFRSPNDPPGANQVSITGKAQPVPVEDDDVIEGETIESSPAE